jgi:hypothetical protein
MAKNQKATVVEKPAFACKGLTSEHVLSGYQEESPIGHVLQSINLSTINFFLGVAVNLNPLLKQKAQQTEVQKKFASLLNLDSERPKALNGEMQLEEDKKVSDIDKLQSAIEGIQATLKMGDHIKEVSFDSSDKSTTNQIKFELEGGELGGGLQSPVQRISTQGSQYASNRITQDKIIAQNKALNTEQSLSNIEKRENIILSQVAEQTNYKLAELESNQFELSENADYVDVILDACKKNNIDMNAILEKSVIRKYKSWTDNQNFDICSEVAWYGEYLTNK